MSKEMMNNIYKNIENRLTDEKLLKNIGMTKFQMKQFLKQYVRNNLKYIQIDDLTCVRIFEILKSSMEYFCDEPEPNWLGYIHEYIITDVFKGKETFISQNSREKYKKPVVIFLEILATILECKEKIEPRDPKEVFKFLERKELKNSTHIREYEKLQEVIKEKYILELLKLSREIMPFDLLWHISGVHYIAVHVAKQLNKLGKPVDLSLVSGSAITHDLGKFGCSKKETARIPYLHYYYTEQFCNQFDLKKISHIASNHSTWDLELENLSVESLILIYSDFRVKSSRIDGKEIVHFYSLDEAFDVILSKLDNVDDEKERRYKKVYAKLKDFENYMISLGINVDLSCSAIVEKQQKDANLLQGMEVVERLKFMAIEHNIGVMHSFNEEVAFANLLEMARSEWDWKNLRGYLNIIREYHTYMTIKQKQTTLKFLYELLSHREGDIRRETASLMGNIVAQFDREYRKELPEGTSIQREDVNGVQIWKKYIDKIINPTYRATNQQKRWIGFSLRIFVRSFFEKYSGKNRVEFVEVFFEFLKKNKYDDNTNLMILEAVSYIDREKLTKTQKSVLNDYLNDINTINSIESQIVLFNFTSGEMGRLPQEKTLVALFRENLNFNVSWIVKSNNIDVLLEMRKESPHSQLQMATHFANLLKTCDIVAIRHKAGRSLLQLVKELPLAERNEIAVDLCKGLEIGEYEYSKYIPQYLGDIVLHLEKEAFLEFLDEIYRLIENKNERVSSVALDTLGYIIKNYENSNKSNIRFVEENISFMLGMILKGLGHYKNQVSQQAFTVLGSMIFASDVAIESRIKYFKIVCKKMMTLIEDTKEDLLTFYNNAGNLNHIYRFISDYIHTLGDIEFEGNKKVAFFPGSFDPFSLGHKEIAKTIRDLGFEVYLAIDEFSWSKKVQPHKIRRNLCKMSVADQLDVYIFPENTPINIAKEESLKKLIKTLKREDVYLVVGSDVVENASSYKVENKDFIYDINHIIFDRITSQGQGKTLDKEYLAKFRKDVIRLSLEPQYEDISSTQIRENIDSNRKIGYLVDNLAEQYIYDKKLYLREPQYKGKLEIENLRIGNFRRRNSKFLKEMPCFFEVYDKVDRKVLTEYIERNDTKTIVVRDRKNNKKIIGFATAKEIGTSNLYDEFQNIDFVRDMRKDVRGKILMIGNVFSSREVKEVDVYNILITELLAESLKEDFTYCIYKPIVEDEPEVENVFKRCGFKKVYLSKEESILTVDMTNPVVLMENTIEVLKAPFNKELSIKELAKENHARLQRELKKLYENHLILSLNSKIMQNKMIKIIARNNRIKELKPKGEARVLGENMCVPFGQTMKSTLFPSTVTKAIHLEKVFNSNLEGYEIEETPHYAQIENQVSIIKAFDRPVILLDDLLHKGYRLQKLTPFIKKKGLDVKSVVVGILSANGKDLAKMHEYNVESAYFIPHLKAWFSEMSQYPFVSSDGVVLDEKRENIRGINLILPYSAPQFLKERSKEDFYNFSMVCLENSYRFFKEIERIYQEKYEKKLTLDRLQEVFSKVTICDGIENLEDIRKSPSDYIKSDIDKLQRLKGIIS